MTQADLLAYLTSELQFMKREEADNPVKHWTNFVFSVDVFPAYTLYHHRHSQGLHLSLSWNENNDPSRHDFVGISLSNQELTKDAVFAFLQRSGYPPAVRLHRLAILRLLAVP